MTPSWCIELVFTNINERNLDNSNKVMFFGVVVMVPNLEVEVF